jgi:hypothetical protein
VLLAAGIASTLGAVVAFGGAAAMLLVVGSDEAIESPVVRARSDGVALVVDDLRAEADLLAPAGVGSLQLVVRGDGPVFVGEASPALLDEYLAGAPYDAIVSLGPVRTSPVPGTQQPPPPTSVEIWARSATGDPARLELPTTSGTSLVLMRVDARPGVEVAVAVLLRLPGSWTAGWVLLAVGVLLLALAVLAFVRSRRSRPVPRHAAGSSGDVLPGLPAPPTADVPPATGPPGETVPPGDTPAAAATGGVSAVGQDRATATATAAAVSLPEPTGDAVDEEDEGLAESDPSDPDSGLMSSPEPTAPPTAPQTEPPTEHPDSDEPPAG